MSSTITSTSVTLSCDGTGVAVHNGNTRQGAYASTENGASLPTNVTSITGTLVFSFSSLASVAQLKRVKLSLTCTDAGGNYIKEVQCYATSVTNANKLTLKSTNDIARNRTVYIEWTDNDDLDKILSAISNNEITLKMNNGETSLSAGAGTDHYTTNYMRANAATLEIEYYAQEELTTVHYYKDNAWHPCRMHYYNGTTWVQVKPYYYDGTDWRECRVT